jgi:hypothetical protein
MRVSPCHGHITLDASVYELTIPSPALRGERGKRKEGRGRNESE